MPYIPRGPSEWLAFLTMLGLVAYLERLGYVRYRPTVPSRRRRWTMVGALLLTPVLVAYALSGILAHSALPSDDSAADALAIAGVVAVGVLYALFRLLRAR